MNLKTAARHFLVLFILCSLFLSLNNFSCFAAEKQKSPLPKQPFLKTVPENAFKDKETIKFKVYSGGIRVGAGKLTYHGAEDFEGKSIQHISLDITTLNIRDKEEVYGSLDFSSPVLVKRRIKLFGRQEVITENYSPDRKTLRVFKSVNDSPLISKTIRSEKELGNVLLLIYRLRNSMDLKVGMVYKIVLPTQEFDLIVKSKKALRVPLGLFDTYYLESLPAKYKIWISSGKKRLPARIQGLVPGGLMYLVATEVVDQD